MQRPIPSNLKVGDVVGFSGASFWSALISIGTGGIPRWGLSHVGIMGFSKQRDGLLLFESVDGEGVRCKPLCEVVDEYHGRVWLYRLYRPLFLDEVVRMTTSISGMLHRPYDVKGALWAAGKLWALAHAAIRRECLTSLFCSELVAEQLSFIGIFNTANSSRWNPRQLVRALRKRGIVERQERLK